MYTKYRLKYGWVWLSVVAALILYLQTISHGYNLDDGLLRAPHIEEEGWKRYVAFFTHPYFDSSTGHKYGYRPVVLISYELERSLLGELPAISHAVNLLIYLSIAVLLYFLLKKLCVGRTQIAGIATLLFILHPLHTEVVASIKNRDELLAFFFFICSYLAYIRYAKIGGWIWVWGLVAATLALLSKKSALVPLLLMPMGLLMIYDRSSTSESKNRARIALVCVSLLVVLFLYSPIGLRKSIVAAILSLGGWTALYLTSNRSTGTRIYGAQVLVCTLLLVGWGIGMVGYEYVLVGVVVGARICQWKWTKKGYWFELIFLGVVTSVACQWSEHMLVWLMGLYVLLWITEYSDSKAQNEQIAVRWMVRAMSLGLLILIALMLQFSDYSALSFFRLSLLLSLGIGTYFSSTRRWIIVWMLLLPMMGYLYNGSLEGVWALLGAAYLLSTLKLRRLVLQSLGWGLCLYVCLLSCRSRLTLLGIEKIPPAAEASTRVVAPTPDNNWLIQEVGRDLHPTENPHAFSDRMEDKLIAAVYTYGRYLRLHLVPYPLRVYYGYGVWSGGSVERFWFWAGGLTHLALLFAAVWFFRRVPQLSFALFFYLIALFPFSNAWVWVAGGMAERLAFAASLGYLLAMAYLIVSLRERLRVVVLVVVSLTYAVITYQRAALWKDRETLFLHDHLYTPSAKLYQLIGDLYLARARELIDLREVRPTAITQSELSRDQAISAAYLKKSEHYLRASFGIHEGTGDHWFSLGIVEQLQYDIPAAISAYKRALRALPDHKKARFNLASCYDAMGNHRAAESEYISYIKHSPEDESAYANLAFMYFREGNYPRALDVTLEAKHRFGDQANTWLNLARIYLAQRDTILAIQSLSRAHQLDPRQTGIARQIRHLSARFQRPGDSK